jgi:hypothetical protein
MKANEYALMVDTIEVGVNRCARRLSKRGNDAAAAILEDADVKAVIEEMVMDEICQRWHFEGDEA